MKRFLLSLFLLLTPALAFGQSITMPANVKVPANRLAEITIVYDGEMLEWRIIGATDADTFREYTQESKTVRLRLLGYVPQKLAIVAAVVKDGKLAFAVCNIIVGEGPAPIPPDPKPLPPKPEPEPKPDPVNPAPIPVAGLRVLIVYETADKMTPTQGHIVFGRPMRDFLEKIVVKGPDGKTPELRMWDQNVDTRQVPKLWQDVMARPRASIPWLVVSNGITGYEGPLPTTVEEAKKLIQKYNPNIEKEK